jgi:Surface antigen variable number repeat
MMRIAIFLLGLASLGAGAVAQTPTREASAPVHVRSLTIISKDLPEPERLQVAHAFKDCTCPLLEISSRIKWKLYDLGYGQATAEIPHLADLLAAPPTGPVDISVLVTAGAKYRIDVIVIKGAIAFPKEDIIPQLPVAPGDVFNATAMVKGLDNIRKLYASKGYMNFVAIPTLQYDETQHMVVLTIDIDEGQPSGSGR